MLFSLAQYYNSDFHSYTTISCIMNVMNIELCFLKKLYLFLSIVQLSALYLSQRSLTDSKYGKH